LPQHSHLNSIGSPFIELQSIGSTNDYARSLLQEGKTIHGAVIFTHEQSAGKGQRGKAWLSERGANIIMSIVIKPQSLGVLQQFELSVCIAVAVNDFFGKYAGNETKTKWPNDLYYKNRKAGGILIENIIGEERLISGGPTPQVEKQNIAKWKWAIIGIGINLNQTTFPDILNNPVSLKQITGKDYDPVNMAKELCGNIDTRFQQLISGDFNNLFTQYLLHIYKINEPVRLKKGNRVFEAIIKNVSSSGKLIVQHGIEEEFEFGMVEWL